MLIYAQSTLVCYTQHVGAGMWPVFENMAKIFTLSYSDFQLFLLSFGSPGISYILSVAKEKLMNSRKALGCLGF